MENRTDSIAGYFELEYALTGDLTLTAGGRYTSEDESIRFTSRDDDRPNDVVIYDISTEELRDGGVPVDQDVRGPTSSASDTASSDCAGGPPQNSV